MNITKSFFFILSIISPLHVYAMKSIDATFFRAAGEGDVATLEQRIHAGVDINARSDKGDTALHNAIEHGQVEAVKKLLEEKHISVALINPWSDKTALAIARDNYRSAAKAGNEEKKNKYLQIIDLFFANNKREVDRDFLRSVVLNDIPEIKRLFVADANPNVRGRGIGGMVPLIYIINNYYSGYTPEQVIELVSLLLSKGDSPNVQDNTGLTPLMMAVRTNNVPVAKLLLDKGAAVNMANQGGYTALHFAEQQGNIEMTELLLAHDADPNMKDQQFKRTPLHDAARRGSVHMIRLLLQAGADPNVQDADKFTPLGQAIPLSTTLTRAQLEIIKALIEKGANPNIPSGTKTPLEIAIEQKPRFKGFEQVWDDAIAMLKEASAKYPGGQPVTPIAPIKPVTPSVQPVTPPMPPTPPVQPTDGGLVKALNALTRTLGDLQTSLK